MDVPVPLGGVGVELFLAAWTPGSYLIREYARHLGDFRVEATGGELTGVRGRTQATGGELIGEHGRTEETGGELIGERGRTQATGGEVVAWRKTAKNRYRVGPPPPGCEGLSIFYTIYAHELSVRTSDLTDQHAFLSGSAVYLWPVGGGPCPVEVHLLVPPRWEVACALDTPSGDTAGGTPGNTAGGTPGNTAGGTAGGIPGGVGGEPGREFVLRADSLDELIDSPILAGVFETLSFEVLEKPHALILDGLAGVSPPESLVPDTIAIIEQAAAIFGGEMPYERYQFLCMFTDSGRGGLEHRASSALLAPRTTFRPEKDYREFMSLVAHEFFHVWNVKRMRPTGLWEFDYEQENYTELLWVAEGFTAYYDDHLCRRAGVMTSEQYLGAIAANIAELRRTPGRLHQTLCEASFDAWIRLYRPGEDTRNSTLSYYGNGALAAMVLDLRIRQETEGRKSLDDVVRLLYERTFLADRGYGYEDIVEILSEVAGTDLADLVHSLARQPLDPDFDEAFASFGLAIEEHDGSPAYLGVHFKSGSTNIASVVRDSPADLAGLMPGDEILALASLRVTGSSWSKVFDVVATADHELELLVARRGRILDIVTSPSQRPATKLSIKVAKTSSPEQDRLRRGWLFDDSI